ncbi:MAG TPA: cellulose biosynthesis (CelD)-like protein, partial [Myxococcaceae bacterium]|nr:cellulose biosynthesis (CelD)-like protein [Myxococcaceae bacterium]
MEARQLTPVPDVVEVTERTTFMTLEPEWNALVGATADEPFYRHDFFRVWMDNFAPESRPRVLTLRDEQGHLGGALPLMEGRTSMYGVPVRQ